MYEWLSRKLKSMLDPWQCALPRDKSVNISKFLLPKYLCNKGCAHLLRVEFRSFATSNKVHNELLHCIILIKNARIDEHTPYLSFFESLSGNPSIEVSEKLEAEEK